MDNGARLRVRRVEVHPSLPSTQDELRRRLDAGEEVDGLVLRALEQTHGRGQRARDWVSGPGGSYQTLAVRVPPLIERPLSTLTLAVALAEVLSENGARVQLKWPNDLYYRQKKLGGILCEVHNGHLLMGIGLNVKNPLPENAVGLRGWELECVHALVLEGLVRGLEWLTQPFDLSRRYAPFDMLAGMPLTVTTPAGLVVGVGRGVNDAGCLRLEQRESVHTVCHGRVRFLALSG